MILFYIYFYSYLLPKATHMQYWSGSGSQTKQADIQRSSQQGSLTLVDQLFATLMRLRLGLLVQDIADRFNISSATVSKYFTTWLSLLHLELDILNPFPSRSAIDRTMPDIFKPKYESVRVILDCTEINVQRSWSILNQALTFSNYKHHNTEISCWHNTFRRNFFCLWSLGRESIWFTHNHKLWAFRSAGWKWHCYGRQWIFN